MCELRPAARLGITSSPLARAQIGQALFLLETDQPDPVRSALPRWARWALCFSMIGHRFPHPTESKTEEAEDRHNGSGNHDPETRFREHPMFRLQPSFDQGRVALRDGLNGPTQKMLPNDRS